MKAEIRITGDKPNDLDIVFSHGELSLRISKVIWKQMIRQIKEDLK